MNASNPELQRLLAMLKGNTDASNSALVTSNTENQWATTVNGVRNSTTSSLPGLGGAHPVVNNALVTDSKSNSVSSDPRLRNRQLQVSKSDQETSRSSTPTPQSIPDASSITTWPAAIKHVTKHVVTQEKVTSRIKHLISEQQKHEELWWKQREEIVNKHAGRVGSQARVADILKELGGLAVPIAKVDEAADKNELEAFDKKVYKSLTQMAADFDGQLRKMGVPFFSIKHELVMTENGKEDATSTRGKLDRGELRELQKRMIQYLEDLLVD